jgi:ATP-binding cassette subfamily C protein CydCD
MLRFLDPQKGRILLGGRDLRDLPLDFLRRHIAVVAQDTYLFYGTVAENLRVARPDATREEIEAAARAANAHDFIMGLPNDYETVVGERGARLSGGERQRLAIARALLKDASILVLDEALSSVDAQNESVIQEALNRLMEGRTTLIIAHRLSSVIDAHRILVLDEGRIVESGSHAELIGAKGVYADLMAGQQHSSNAEIASPALSSPGKEYANGNGQSAHAGTVLNTNASGSVRTAPLPVFATLRRLLALVRPFAFKTTLAFSSGVLYQAALIGVGISSALVVAQVIRHGAIFWPILLLGVAVVATSVLSWLETWIAHDLAYQLLAEMRIDMYRTLDPLAPGYLLRRRSGDLVSIISTDVETIEVFFAHTVAPAFVAILIPGIVLLSLGWIGWPLAFALLPFLFLVAVSPLFFRQRSAMLGTRVRETMGQLNARLVDGIQGIRELVGFGCEQRFTEDLSRHSREVAETQVRFQTEQARQASLNEALTSIGSLAVLVAGVWLVSRGEMIRAFLPLASVLAMAAFGPVSEITRTFKELMETLASARRVFAIKDEPIPVTDGPGVPPSAATSRIPSVIFENTSFAYGPDQPPVLHDVSFRIETGQTVALVGPSGAGKTTCAQLLLRFWDPTRGKILVEGNDLRAFGLDELRARMALVSQETYLFNTTIRANLRLARPDASDAAIEEAARLANAHDFISELPLSYDTLVGERGVQLSGGQRQRLAIARALLKNAPILILDEATSHLHAVNEQLIHQALARLAQGRTTLVIAHRLSTIRDADRIVVLDQGRIVEQGSHAALLNQNGLYSQLIAAQLIGSEQASRQRSDVRDHGGAH